MCGGRVWERRTISFGRRLQAVYRRPEEQSRLDAAERVGCWGVERRTISFGRRLQDVIGARKNGRGWMLRSV
jgi:hypothetical protein